MRFLGQGRADPGRHLVGRAKRGTPARLPAARSVADPPFCRGFAPLLYWASVKGAGTVRHVAQQGVGTVHGIALKHKFAVLLGAIIVLCLGLNLAWQVQGGFRQTERELVQQARALSANMDAVWEFMVINQKLINYDSAGNYEFKGLQCSIAGRSIGSLFSTKTEYVTHYVSETPRNHADTPDPFESGALAAFFEDSSLEEYYQVVQTENGQAFRYCAPMRMEKNCLECHGSPAGEIDVSGYPKEGLAEGDLYGALSLTIPMGAYEAASRENAVSNVVFSAMLLAASLVTIYIALTVLVTKPFGRVRDAMAAVGRGDLSVRLGQERSSAEARDMARGFDLMAEAGAHVRRAGRAGGRAHESACPSQSGA